MILSSYGDGDLPLLRFCLVINTCRKQEKKGLKTVILAVKVLGDLKVFLLVIGDLRNHLILGTT